MSSLSSPFSHRRGLRLTVPRGGPRERGVHAAAGPRRQHHQAGGLLRHEDGGWRVDGDPAAGGRVGGLLPQLAQLQAGLRLAAARLLAGSGQHPPPHQVRQHSPQGRCLPIHRQHSPQCRCPPVHRQHSPQGRCLPVHRQHSPQGRCLRAHLRVGACVLTSG